MKLMDLSLNILSRVSSASNVRPRHAFGVEWHYHHHWYAAADAFAALVRDHAAASAHDANALPVDLAYHATTRATQSRRVRFSR